MCLGKIGQIVEVHHDGRAVVDIDGALSEVLEMTVADDDIEVGDWVVVHAGFALERITEAAAKDALAIRATSTADTEEKLS